MKITALFYNWYAGPYGEEVKSYHVGFNKVIKIIEHRACGEGDRWYYDVIFSDSHRERIFNPNEVVFSEEES